MPIRTADLQENADYAPYLHGEPKNPRFPVNLRFLWIVTPADSEEAKEQEDAELMEEFAMCEGSSGICSQSD